MAVTPEERVQQDINGQVPLFNNGRSSERSPAEPPAYAHFQVEGRFRRIVFFFGNIILQIVFWDLILARLPLFGDWARSRRPQRMRQSARRFRALALEMGGVMIKLGQFLSARVDVLPLEITEELRGLQDEVPPEPNWRMMSLLQSEIPDFEEKFIWIEKLPLAAASLGQAYRAKIKDVHDEVLNVVIKIQRPNIESIVRTDLDALRLVARWIVRYPPIRRRANVPLLMEEFARTLWEELDYIMEADNAERFAEMYADSEVIYIPAVYRMYTTRRIIVLENVEAIKITDVAAMKQAEIDPKQVAETLLDTFFYQIFQEGFFHADPHPGNLFVRPREDLPWPVSANGEGPALGRPFWLIFVDFGMVGHVPNLIGDNLRKVIISVLQKDGRHLTDAYADLGFFLPDADLDRITEAQNVILERIWGRSLLELAQPDPQEVQELSQEFRDLLFDFPIQVPQDFIYLGRALGMVSGLVSQLDEDINPWYYIEKYGEAFLEEQDTAEFTIATVWQVARPYLSLPGQVQRLIATAESGQLRVKSDRDLIKRYDRMEKRLGQLGWSIVAAAGIMSATLLWIFRKRDE